MNCEIVMTLEEKMNLLADSRRRYDELKKQFDNENADLSDAIKSLEEQIKVEVISIGKTVKTDLITAVYSKGKISWDSSLLVGYSMAHPEILKAQKIGKPTVSFRIEKK